MAFESDQTIFETNRHVPQYALDLFDELIGALEA